MIKQTINVQKWFAIRTTIMVAFILMTGLGAQSKAIQRSGISAGNIQAKGNAYQLNGTVGGIL